MNVLDCVTVLYYTLEKNSVVLTTNLEKGEKMDAQFISETELFEGCSARETEEMLKCLGAQKKTFSKEAMIYHTGEKIQRMGLLLSGGINIVRNDAWGNQNIIGHIAPGEVFAETYACISGEPLLADVIAVKASEVLFLDVWKVMSTCSSSCSHHQRLIHNLVVIMASKNLHLTQKINHITPKTIRERLLSYLSQEAVRQGKESFEIPFNRQQMADYLSVERSALSAELSKMQKDGLLIYRKNHFTLKGEKER